MQNVNVLSKYFSPGVKTYHCRIEISYSVGLLFVSMKYVIGTFLYFSDKCSSADLRRREGHWQHELA